MKSPSELLEELKEFVASLEKDANKATRGMKAGGIRLRAAMQQVRQLATAIRKSVLEYRNTTKKRTESKAKEDEKTQKYDRIAEDKTEIVHLPEFSPYWYSDFNY